MRPAVAVGGSLAQRPFAGGHAWVFLQYLLGFRRLGWDVLFVDRLEPDMCVDDRGDQCDVRASVNYRYLVDVMEGFDLGDRWMLLHDDGREVLGVDRSAGLAHLERSAFLLNVMGFVDDRSVTEAAGRLVFLDIDPGFGQMWRALDLHDMFAGHDAHVTIGENIGRDDCTIPTAGIDWITTKQPVVLDHWPVTPPVDDRFTSVGAWRGPFGPIEWQGQTYGLRVHRFRELFDLPHRTGARFELALDIHPEEVPDLDGLTAAGWELVDPVAVAADPWSYRSYLQGSGAELMVAKDMYVRSRSGWFSDRSICYLASGRPVLATDTGLESLLPVGMGLLTFTTLDEAIEGAASIDADRARHSAAARRIATEHFDSDRVLGRLLGELDVDGPGRS